MRYELEIKRKNPGDVETFNSADIRSVLNRLGNELSRLGGSFMGLRAGGELCVENEDISLRIRCLDSESLLARMRAQVQNQ